MNKRRLKVIYVRPATYDDDGYVLRFWRGLVPSNTLCCLDSLTRAVAESCELGDGVEVTVDTYDDTMERVPIKRIARMNRRPDTRVVVGFVGVQSNQFPRAADLAMQLADLGVQTMIGGFHVSGMLALFDKPSHELQRCIEHGVTLVKGEAEAPGVMAQILGDALAGSMRPVYDIREFPDIEHAPVPTPSEKFRKRRVSGMATIDTSRGCPFSCTFCTIINVQGRKMRHRSSRCVLDAIERNYARGIETYFFTDDNFSRNPVWEEILDGLIDLRERGVHVNFMMQADVLAAKIPGFVDKAARAGCYMVFIGMETVNQENLAAIGKPQNRVSEYADMVAAWQEHDVTVHVGYIIGLPFDTRESIRRDIEALKNEVKVNEASFFMLTPLPGSKDHRKMVEACTALDADHNNYDGIHETFRHPRMPVGEWLASYHDAMAAFYDKENMVNNLLRTPRKNYRLMLWTYVWYRYAALEGLHPMATGVYRLKDRASRRPMFARENVFKYAWRRLKDAVHGFRRHAGLFFEFQEIWMLTCKPDDPRWAVLADLRTKWAVVQQRIRVCDIRGRCDVAAGELKGALASAADRMRQLSKAGGNLSYAARRQLHRQVSDIESYLRTFDVQKCGWHKVIEAESFMTDTILARYEELTIHYVAKRRAFNAYRRDFIERLKSGRVLTLNIGRIPYVLLFEIVVACHLGASVRQMKWRPPA